MSINMELDVHYRGWCGYESKADTDIDMNMDIGLDVLSTIWNRLVRIKQCIQIT